MNGNNKNLTIMVVTVIVSIIVAASGVIWGSLQSGWESKIDAIKMRQDKMETVLMELVKQKERTVIQLDEINKKLDRLIDDRE